ncbi:MAG TPA: acyltransferase family protein [Bauldia sp.]|nr:acyltransferase family protein [Bauldia sp.]
MPSANAAPRRFYIDNLRNIAVLLLIVFHTARLFDAESWHMKDVASYQLAGVVIDVINQWHMPLFFLLTGMAAFLAVPRRGAGGFVRERVFRLFIPLLFGILVAVLPQVYLERISPYVPNRQSPVDFTGGFFDFVPQFFTSVYPEGNFSYHHLWFIWYLFLYSLLLAPLFAVLSRPRVMERVAKAGAWFAGGWRILLLGLPVTVAEGLLRAEFPSTHATIDDWANHAHFLLVILVGWLVASAPALVERAAQIRWIALGLGAATTLITLPAPEWMLLPAPAGWYVTGFIYFAGEWLWLVAFLGFGVRLLNRRVPYLTAFTRYAFPFYIAHQAVIVFLGWLTFDWQSAPFLKYLAIAVLAAAISYIIVRLLDLTAPTRFLIGLRSPRQVPLGERAPA